LANKSETDDGGKKKPPPVVEEPGDEPDTPSDEEVGKEWLRVLAADEVVAVLREVHDIEWLKELQVELRKALEPATVPRPPVAPVVPASVVAPASTLVIRRPI